MQTLRRVLQRKRAFHRENSGKCVGEARNAARELWKMRTLQLARDGTEAMKEHKTLQRGQSSKDTFETRADARREKAIQLKPEPACNTVPSRRAVKRGYTTHDTFPHFGETRTATGGGG